MLIAGTPRPVPTYDGANWPVGRLMSVPKPRTSGASSCGCAQPKRLHARISIRPSQVMLVESGSCRGGVAPCSIVSWAAATSAVDRPALIRCPRNVSVAQSRHRDRRHGPTSSASRVRGGTEAYLAPALFAMLSKTLLFLRDHYASQHRRPARQFSGEATWNSRLAFADRSAETFSAATGGARSSSAAPLSSAAGARSSVGRATR